MRQFSLLIIVSMVVGCGQSGSETTTQSHTQLTAEATLGGEGTSEVLSDTVPPVGELELRLIEAGLANIKVVIPDALVDLKYSSTDNFFGMDVYGDLENAYLQPEVAEMLRKAYELLQQRNPELTLLVYDGVRPRSVQWILWDNLDKPDSLKPLYVADPRRGSLHNYGVAVDLTLADKQSGEALDMGTHYDYFGYPAYPDREEQMLREGKITHAHVRNRELLRAVMNGAGFKGIGSEWWHFDAFTRKVAAEKFEIVE